MLGYSPKTPILLQKMVRPEGFEPPAYGFEVRRSIQLSYGRIKELALNDKLQLSQHRTVKPAFTLRVTAW